MSQRHHLVPQFYLQAWTVGGKAGLRGIRRSTGEILSLSPKNAAVETDAYAIEVPGKGKDYVAEKVLGAVESEAALALRNMLRTWPPSDSDRERWSMLIALQVTRGRDFRDNQNAVAEYLLKTQVALDSRDPADMRKRLVDAGLEPTEESLQVLREMMENPDSYHVEMHPARLIHLALQTALEVLRYFALRQWSLVILPQPVLVTTDHPLALCAYPDASGPFGGVGVMTADEIWMPLDPTRLLVMTHPDTEAKVGTVPMERVLSINLRVAAACDDWVFARPGNPQLKEIAAWLEGKPAPRIKIFGPTPAQLSRATRRTSEFDRDDNPPSAGG